jgi:DNA-binding response OmpR family regulator
LTICSQRSILIIDDDLAILQTFRRIFQRKGYNVTVVERGNDAIKKIRKKHYDIALIDFCLPDMEGTELFPLISKSSPKTVKVMVTGKFLDKIKGADLLIGKPVNPCELLSLIDTKLKDQNVDV